MWRRIVTSLALMGLGLAGCFVVPASWARAPRGFAFSDLLPEIDQVALGISTARVLDPLLDAKHAGAKISLSLFEGEDHFLFFSQRERALAEIGAMLHASRL